VRPDHDIDVVMPIPDTSRTAALQVATRLGVKYREGFIKNRYIGRTFIMPEQSARRASVRRKLNAIGLEFNRKNVLLVDDSIVRGTTSQKIVGMIRGAGASEVHMRISSPPTIGPCRYGIDTPTSEELIAFAHSQEEIRKYVGADSLGYLSLEGLFESVNGGRGMNGDGFCDACFTNNQPIQIQQPARLRQLRLVT
jgi:amidophosphoribosyltransferase